MVPLPQPAAVGVALCVLVGVAVGVGALVGVPVTVGVSVAVAVSVTVGVRVGVAVVPVGDGTHAGQDPAHSFLAMSTQTGNQDNRQQFG